MRWFALCGILPALAWGFDYEACRKRVGAATLDPKLVERFTDGLLEQTRLSGSSWCINAESRASAVNLLFPSEAAAGAWDAEACGGSADVARCWSFPKSRSIVCNPAFSAWLRRANFFEPPIRPDVALAGRFLAQSILGHELGHLEVASTAIAGHTAPDVDALRCSGNAVSPESEEVACDARGASLACGPARASDSLRYLLKSVGGELSWKDAFAFATRVRGELREYAPRDDACTGRDGYESFSVRRRKLALDLLDCIIKRDTNPWSEALIAEVDDFHAVEKSLRRLQTFATWVDGEGDPRGSERAVALTAETFLVSGYRDGKAVLQLLQRSRAAVTRHALEGSFPGRIVSARPVRPQRWELLFRRSGDKTDLFSVASLSCDALDEGRCSVSKAQAVAKVPHDSLPAVSRQDGTVFVARPGRLELYSAKQPGRLLASHAPSFSRGEPKLAAIRDANLAVSSQFDGGGLCVIEVTTPQRQSFKELELPERCRLADLMFHGDQLSMLVDCDNGTQWVDCPAPQLTAAGKHLSLAACTSRTVPPLGPENLVLFSESMALAPQMYPAPLGCSDGAMLSQNGWSLIDTDGKWLQLPAEHVIACDADGEFVAVREGKLNWLARLPDPAPAPAPELPR